MQYIKYSKSIELIMNSKVDYEFRTTVLKSQLTFDDFDKIGQLINGAKRYYLQKFVPSKILDNSLIMETSYSDEELSEILLILGKYLTQASVR